jgi:hypothetical protein
MRPARLLDETSPVLDETSPVLDETSPLQKAVKYNRFDRFSNL